jgi:hypothetical protein
LAPRLFFDNIFLKDSKIIESLKKEYGIQATPLFVNEKDADVRALQQ